LHGRVDSPSAASVVKSGTQAMTDPYPTSKGEPQYEEPIRLIKALGPERLGLMTAWAYLDDPKRLAFTFARYKFVAKMLAGCTHVLEVGCGDAFATRIVRQEVERVTAVDFDASFVADANERRSDRWPIECLAHDLLDGPVPGSFDGIFSLDVLEHILPENEDRFLGNMVASLGAHGTVVIGMPSLQSQAYASVQSKAGHVNCKDQPDFKRLMRRYFHNVYMFSMNDEVVHTGYQAMSHYNLALCCAKR
jgi:2-polyprenyl-3-methyl-5-hydroxy-6-metoxy-1,4-benzoquinol methylase